MTLYTVEIKTVNENRAELKERLGKGETMFMHQLLRDAGERLLRQAEEAEKPENLVVLDDYQIDITLQVKAE